MVYFSFWYMTMEPYPSIKTTYALTAIVFVISVRTVDFSVAHICCQHASSPMTAKHAGRTFTIVFVWFIFTCKVTITSQIFLDTLAIFARKLPIATPEIWKVRQINSFYRKPVEIDIFVTFLNHFMPRLFMWLFASVNGHHLNELYICLSSLHFTTPQFIVKGSWNPFVNIFTPSWSRQFRKYRDLQEEGEGKK